MPASPHPLIPALQSKTRDSRALDLSDWATSILSFHQSPQAVLDWQIVSVQWYKSRCGLEQEYPVFTLKKSVKSRLHFPSLRPTPVSGGIGGQKRRYCNPTGCISSTLCLLCVYTRSNLPIRSLPSRSEKKSRTLSRKRCALFSKARERHSSRMAISFREIWRLLARRYHCALYA